MPRRILNTCNRASGLSWRDRRRGSASMLAMLYLVLFSTLSVGFFAAFTLATQTAYNDRGSRRALAAAESGMEFVRFHLWSLDIAPTTPPEELFDAVADQLAGKLNGTANLAGGNLAVAGDTILIPGDPNGFIPLNGEGDGFRVDISRAGKELVVSVSGRTAEGVSTANVGRAVRLRYGIFERPSSIFDFGVASKSSIDMVGNTAILGSPDPAAGSVLSTAQVPYPLTMGSRCEISGEVSFTNPDAWVSAGSNSVINNEVGEPNWRDNVHFIEEPDFPVVDTSDYLPYATNTITSSSPVGTQFYNIRIPPNTNPTFANGTEIHGVVYIEGPNTVTFAGHVSITGIIVTENDSEGSWTDGNLIQFLGTVDANGVQGLPEEDLRFEGLDEMGGAFMLAENFSVLFGGNATVGNTNITGTIVASNVTFDGTSDAMIDGSIINLEPKGSVHFSGNGNVTIRSTGTRSQPHGLYFGSRYVPLPGSYEEVIP